MPSRPKSNLQLLPSVLADPTTTGGITPNLAGGGVTPRLDTTAAIAPAMGMAQVGEGLQKMGSAVTALYQKKEEADTITAEYKSAELMAQARADIAKATGEEQDQSKWGGIADARLGQLSQELGKLPNVPPEARQLLDHKTAMMGIDVKDGLERHKIQKSFKDAIDSGNAVVKIAGDTGDLKLGESTIDGMVEKKFYTPEEGEAKKLDLRANVTQFNDNKQKEVMLGAIQADPEAAMRAIRDNPDLKPSQKQFGINAAHAGIRAQVSATTDDINNQIAMGVESQGTQGIYTPEQVDKYAEAHPEVSPAMKQEMKQTLARQSNAATRQYMAANGPALASRLDSDISLLAPNSTDQPDNISKDDYYALKGRIASLPSEFHKDLNGELEALYQGKPLTKADKTLVALGKSATRQMFLDGEFGPIKSTKVETVMGPDGKPMADAENADVKSLKKLLDSSWITGEIRPSIQAALEIAESKAVVYKTQKVNGEDVPVYKEERDPKLVEKATWARAKVDRQFQEWANLHPKATIEDGQKYLSTLVPAAKRASYFDSMDVPPAPVPDDKITKGGAVRSAPADEPLPDSTLVPTQTDTRDPGDDLPPVDAPSLFPTGGDKTVGGDSMFSPADRGEDLPPERKKRR